MANSVIIAQVIEVLTLTTGNVKSAAGVVMSYSDATLSTRGVELELAEWISGTFDGATVTNVCSLTEIYAQGLEEANSENILTASGVHTKLQTYNCCAQKQALRDVDEKSKGQKGCPELVADSKLMRNLIKPLCGIVPEGEVISGRQATYQFVITGVGNVFVSMDVTITVGSAIYGLTFVAVDRTVSSVAEEIAAYINNLFESSFDYYAESSGANVIVSGINFDDDNGTAVTIDVLNGTIDAFSPNALAGGTQGVAQGENPITNESIQVILDKLNSLCKIPCDKIFSSN